MPSENTEYYGIIFDLDDTLLSTSPVYYKTFVQMMLWLYEDMVPHFIRPEEIIEVHDSVRAMRVPKKAQVTCDVMFEDLEIDSKNDISDYPRQLVEVYIECCLRAKEEPKRETAIRIHRLANEKLVHPDSYRFMPHALKLLKYLVARQNVRLFLVTAGPKNLQMPKIESRVIFSRFDRIKLLPISQIHEKGRVFKEWQEEFDYITEWIVIGDSVPIDMNPALATGCFAIHVVDNQSHLAPGSLVAVPNLKERYIKVEDLDDVYRLLSKGLLNAKSTVSFKERARSVCGVEGDVS
jgi:FMN phosphatase YigB (HAD superfamily)